MGEPALVDDRQEGARRCVTGMRDPAKSTKSNRCAATTYAQPRAATRRKKMPRYARIANLPTVLRNAVNRLLGENRPETEIAGRITGMLAKSSLPEVATIAVTGKKIRRDFLPRISRMGIPTFLSVRNPWLHFFGCGFAALRPLREETQWGRRRGRPPACSPHQAQSQFVGCRSLDRTGPQTSQSVSEEALRLRSSASWRRLWAAVSRQTQSPDGGHPDAQREGLRVFPSRGGNPSRQRRMAPNRSRGTQGFWRK